MNVSLLAISIGNTRTQLGTFVEGKLAATHALRNDQPESFAQALKQAFVPLAAFDDAPVLLASVTPPMTEQIAAMLDQVLPDATLLRVERDLPIAVGRQLDVEALIGEDRLLNAAAAYDVLKQAVVIVDAGTAVTVDFVDGLGTFHGGAIAPGAQLMLDSLHEHTALLPEVELVAPAEPVGHNTQQAMLCGAFYGLRGLVRELVEKYAEVAGSFPMVVATGGNAELLFRDFELIDRIVPDLTLLGLAVTFQAAGDTEDQDPPEDEQ